MAYGCMGEFIWQKENVPSWNILNEELKKLLDDFLKEANYCIVSRGSDFAKELLTQDSILRFSIVSEELIKSLQEGLNGSKVPIPMKQWILLGATAEMVLQVFLTVYHSDYLNEEWQQWNIANPETIHDTIKETLKQLVSTGAISSKQKDSLHKAVKEKLEEHTNIHHIDSIMMDELIAFCQKTNLLMDLDYINALRVIQNNRNCIHPYTERSIDNWETLKQIVNIFGCIVDDFRTRTPDDSDDY